MSERLLRFARNDKYGIVSLLPERVRTQTGCSQ